MFNLFVAHPLATAAYFLVGVIKLAWGYSRNYKSIPKNRSVVQSLALIFIFILAVIAWPIDLIAGAFIYTLVALATIFANG